MPAFTRLKITRGTLEVSQRGDYWEVNLNLGPLLPLELLGYFDTRPEAEHYVADLIASAH